MAPQLEFTAKHWTAVGVFLGSIFALVALEPNWSHVLTPKFIGTVGMNGGAFLVALFSNKQPESFASREKRRAKRDAAQLTRFH